MKASIIKEFSNIWPPSSCSVKFNGIYKPYCVEASEEGGYVVAYKSSNNGNLADGGSTEILYGDVQILCGDSV